MKALAGALALSLGALSGCATVAPPLAGPAQAQQVKAYVVRHLQKGEGADPMLTIEGAANARHLADMLADKGIVAIYSTPTNRTMQTAAPLAARLGIPVRSYDPRDPQDLVRLIASAPGPVLVVGHSNTVPDLVKRLGSGPQPPLSDDDYGTVFVVARDGTVTTLNVR